MSTYVLTIVRTIANVHQVAKFRRIDLFVLGGDQEARHSDQLQLGPGNFHAFEAPVNEVDGQVQCLRDELEFQVDFDQPIDEDGAHPLVDVRLSFHVQGSDRRILFFFAVGCVHVFDVSRDTKRVVAVALVNVVQSASDLVGRWIRLRLGVTVTGTSFACRRVGVSLINHHVVVDSRILSRDDHLTTGATDDPFHGTSFDPSRAFGGHHRRFPLAGGVSCGIRYILMEGKGRTESVRTSSALYAKGRTAHSFVDHHPLAIRTTMDKHRQRTRTLVVPQFHPTTTHSSSG